MRFSAPRAAEGGTIQVTHCSRLLLLAAVLAFVPRIEAQAPRATPDSEFARLAALLAQHRLDGTEEKEGLQEQALTVLDRAALSALNASAEPDLNALNLRLSALAGDEGPLGVNFQVVRLTAKRRVFALIANFSLAGPSAVRIYAGEGGQVGLRGRIDRYAQKEFFDENLELVPVQTPPDAPEQVLVTVAGRTDELQTGTFAAWQFDGRTVRQIWSSELLPQSSYESRADGFLVTYCAEPDEDNPRTCRRMVRERYVWNGSKFERVEQGPAPVPKR